MNGLRMNLIAFRRSAGSPGRRGITILEVLIAAGVLAIGMFGVMAMIPLIAMRLREGEIADRSAVLSRNAVEEIQVRGWTDPRRWRWYRLSDARYVDPSEMVTPNYAGAPLLPLGALDWTAWDGRDSRTRSAVSRPGLPRLPPPRVLPIIEV